MAKAISAALLLAGKTSADIAVATFDGTAGTTLKWTEQNDPVMGGKSTGTFITDEKAEVGVFNGTCAIVPFLKAPGFIKAVSTGSTPDVSKCKSLILNVNSQSDYKGFRASFGNEHYPGGKFFAYGYKAHFDAPVGKFGDVEIPFSDFTSHWDDGTGKPITTCAEDPKACPTAAALKDLKTISVWAEGVEGDVHLQIKSIRASGCEQIAAPEAGVTLATFDGASGTTFKFGELNDPVMGGKSTGTWSVNSAEKVGVFDGDVVNVPSLKAPGFIKAAADAKYFPDASSAAGGNVVLTVRTSTPEYKGYRVTLVSGAVSAGFACAGGGSLPFSRGCYKAKFSVPASSADEFQTVRIPLKEFSDLWSSATGEHTKDCADDASACLTGPKLGKIQRIEVWAEGVAGKVHLEVQKIAVEPATIIV